MIKVITNHPVAVESDDHIHPEGTHYDNGVHQAFVDQVEGLYYGRTPISFMDLGCAGGKLVCEMDDRGHRAVGLEGSDHCLTAGDEYVARMGKLPAGYDNWQKNGNKFLFTCDLSKPFEVIDTDIDARIEFDCITCFDVIEHFFPEDLDQFFSSVAKHLKVGGWFIGTIALYPAGPTPGLVGAPEGLDYHKSVYPTEWWQAKMAPHFTELPFPLSTTNRGLPSQTYVFSYKKL